MIDSAENKYEDHLETVKIGLLSIKPAGADGFEGLLRLVLTNLTGIPFRLAASGLQGGMDGNAAMPSDPVCFEAKRYSGDIHRNEVISKIADLSRKTSVADRLWILGATTEISTQLASAVEEDGDKHAISTLVLDWTAAPLPLLAIAVVAAGSKAIDFIVKNYYEKAEQTKLSVEDFETAFASISSHPEFESLLQRLKSNLDVSKLSFKRSVNLNTAWRKQTFGSTRQARERLGQGLAVLQDKTLPPMRAALRKSISDELETRKEVILFGDEGHGKSWLSAQLCSDDAGLALFISAEQLNGVSVQDLDDFLVDLLIMQTGQVADDALKHRWKHRLAAWRITPPVASLLVVVDGLNQRQNLRWDRLLNGIQSRLAAIRGRMVVTVRPQFWQRTIARGLAFKPKTFEVPEWLPAERDGLLKHYGISLDWLDQQTLRTLQNPRLLAVAVATLPHRNAIAWKGLTTDRLLMEHLRASQLENYEDETFVNLTTRLSEHATEVVERVKASPDEPPQNFKADSTAVIETRFFRPLPGPGDLYELREEGLTLALGFTLVDQLWQTHSADHDLASRMDQLVEPINAMDRTADVIFASLLICALDDIRFNPVIFAVLLGAFANLQNVNDARFEKFVEIVKHQPDGFFETVKSLYLEKGRRINQDWFSQAAFAVAETPEGWLAAKAAIQCWLSCYNRDPIEQTHRYHEQEERSYHEALEKRASEINEAVESLSSFESHYLQKMTEVPTTPNALHTLGLQLLAGRPLMDFADSFVAMGLAFALDRNMGDARAAFDQLTTFNRVKRSATRKAFWEAIEPLRSKGTSRGGQWTLVRMLYATGDEDDAAEAAAISARLRTKWPHFDPPSPHEWRQVKVANPKAKLPIDMENGLRHFIDLDVEKMLQNMFTGREDHSFDEFLPIAARFAPDDAIEKARSLLAGLLTRTGFPLRQLILNADEYLPLIEAELATKLVERVQAGGLFDSFLEREQWVLRASSLYCSVAQISAGEQLKCMTSKEFGSDHLAKLTPSLKPQPTHEIVAAVRDALHRNDEAAAYGALTAARYGQTQITSELEELILACTNCASSMLRAAAYELAVCKELDSIRKAHALSDWTAAAVDKKTYESLFGSMLLVEASARGELSTGEVLRRISPTTWFTAAEKLGNAFVEPFTPHFLKRLNGAVADIQKLQPPPFDLILEKHERTPALSVSLREADRENGRFPKPQSLAETLAIDTDFHKKHDKLNSMKTVFDKELEGKDARLLVDDMAMDDLRCLVYETPALLDDLVGILDHADEAQFSWLKNLAFAVANLVAEKSPERAVALMTRASSLQGFVTFGLGDDLTCEHEAIWGSVASEPMVKHWRRRLFGSENELILAREVLAAERFGAADFLRATVQNLASSGDRLDQAYAISIAGYSMQSDKFNDLINQHICDRGVTGQAAKHALVEHENAIWARHWVERMWNAPTPEEFWLYLTIAATSMDARVDHEPPTGSLWRHYAPVFQRARKSAIKNRNKEREKRLLGQEAPEPIFVTSLQ